MFKITKSNPPDYFERAKRKVKRPLQSEAWEDRHIDVLRKKLRKHILLEEQFFLCAYCEKEIDETSKKSNIDHFKTRHLFSKLTLDYNNLLVSCNSLGRCSNYKDQNIRKADYNKIINPVLLDNPNDFFNYHLTGEIYPKHSLSPSDKERAESTLEFFQLNHRGLIEERKNISRQLERLRGQIAREEVFKYLSCYKSFIEYIFAQINEIS